MILLLVLVVLRHYHYTLFRTHHHHHHQMDDVENTKQRKSDFQCNFFLLKQSQIKQQFFCNFKRVRVKLFLKYSNQSFCKYFIHSLYIQQHNKNKASKQSTRQQNSILSEGQSVESTQPIINPLKR